jgi:two-component system CheB/CheR fusion protein
LSAATDDFRIVGVGASAGGLEALEAFFGNMPATDDFAFVVIQHLSPDYKSLMGELLAKHTSMRIVEAEDGVRVEAGSVYLIPRKKNMTVYQRTLFLTEQEHGLNLPIDIFFRSLAEDAGERAVGVILSGTGSDGTRGARAIKELGGLVIVQDEDDAKFDGMPRSAISTGLIDFILPAADIPAELQNFVTGHVTISEADGSTASADSSALTRIYMLVKRRTGVDLSYYKESTITRRIERRMGINQVRDIHRYIEYLEQYPAEVSTLFKEILIGVTRFFRDPDAFDTIVGNVIPEIFHGKQPGEPVRVWVAGCSTGEEAYSIAILLAEYAEQHYLRNDIKIFATDIDKDAIEFASHGLYPESIAADISGERLARFFVKKNEKYQISPTIREMVIFAYHNIFKDPPFRRIDLISCRNLLIYLQSVLQKKILTNFHFSMNATGFMFLGSSETIGDLSRYFRTIDTKWKVFSYKGDHKPQQLRISGADTDWRERLEMAEPTGGPRVAQLPSRPVEPLYERLLADYVPPCAIVDDNRQLVHTFGDLGAYLRIPSGRMELDIIKMAKEEISIPLSTALQSAIRERTTVSYNDIAVTDTGGNSHAITLTVRTIVNHEAPRFAVLFEQESERAGSDATDPPAPRNFDLEESVRRRISDLEGELKYTKENLQATIEELETSNEELQATNEELLSSNEELQSTNEELQSVNEELITVNSEYQKKIEELSELTDDMDNLLSGTAIGTVFLDGDLTIRKYTPPVTTQINIIKTDIGRPFSDLSHNLHYDSLVDDITAVRESRKPSEAEAQNKDGHWFLVKIMPYFTEHDSTEGIVISLVDITERKLAEEALLRQHELLMRVLDNNPSAITIIDHRGRYIYANRLGEELLQLSRDALSGVEHDDPRFGVTDAHDAPLPADELPFSVIQRTRSAVEHVDLRINLGFGDERRAIRVNANPIYDENTEIVGAVLSMRDISEESA